MLEEFEEHQIAQILRSKNLNADILAKLASTTTIELVYTIRIEILKGASILEKGIGESNHWRPWLEECHIKIFE